MKDWASGLFTGAALALLVALTSIDTTAQIDRRGNDPCSYATKSSAVIDISTATTTRFISPVSGQTAYICALDLVTGAANNVALVEGTGGTCGTGTAGMAGGTTAAEGWNFGANGGISKGGGLGTVYKSAGSNVDVCLITSAATQLSGAVIYVLQ